MAAQKELDTAVRVVHLTSSLCRRVQEKLLLPSENGGVHVESKDDDSPVTVADWSVQAVVSWVLSEVFGVGNVSIVAEEDTKALSEVDSSGLLASVLNTVNESLAEAPKYGLPKPDKPLGPSEILEAIGRCNSTGGPGGRHWVLDPVDGTLGFVRGDQYAVALALIEDGKVVLGVLGCPNYPTKKECLTNGCRQIMSKMPGSVSDGSQKGCVMYAKRGSGQAWMQPLLGGGQELRFPNSGRLLKVSSVDDPTLATVCEPVERANTNHLFTAGLTDSMGVKKQPLRVYSMVKYAAIACGDAEIFMKFAHLGYKEKIWDHAAGVVIVEEAGGVVTDAGGRPIDFSRGVYLEGLDRGIVACSGRALHDKIIGAVYASWDSSNL
ncbi:PREDICTED: PAP-specific phosphatase HAL2-like [Tarenaya hassleriana]|uniref:PAP-specific phosphatase HAL2-like n=1 Tax=Tarenaya hassleriana TaxID=28532 RepID=UPI00053C4A0B|nr:PREDICTED: PAP-specific phosphatase HAL2-like [Tarenaya hassleriana]XP_010539645.1 PREDICTED: PAP-specific phosphatase HAL2-like [Tarenaya hassleriana]